MGLKMRLEPASGTERHTLYALTRQQRKKKKSAYAAQSLKLQIQYITPTKTIQEREGIEMVDIPRQTRRESYEAMDRGDAQERDFGGAGWPRDDGAGDR